MAHWSYWHIHLAHKPILERKMFKKEFLHYGKLALCTSEQCWQLKFDFFVLLLSFVISKLVNQLSLVGGVTSWFIPDLVESKRCVSCLFMSAPQRMPRTANMCGNIFCLLRWSWRSNKSVSLLILLHTLCFSHLNQAERGFYLVNKCFKTGEDSHNSYHKQILKMWTPYLSAFYWVILGLIFA